jgi:hypothetical protein
MAGTTRRICELIQVQRGKGRYALMFFRINQVAATCELVHSHLRSSRYITWLRRAHAMTQPAKRIPTWLTIDVLVIVISLAIIGIGIGIGIAP